MKKILIFIALLAFLNMYETYSQFENRFFIAAGLSTNEIIGNDWGKFPILERDTNKPGIIGGGFTSSNPGFQFLMTFWFDTSGVFRIPLGVEYHYYEGLQRVPYTRHYTYFLKHRLDLWSIHLGLDVAFLNLQLAQTKVYTGIEFIANIFTNNLYTANLVHSTDPNISGETLRASKSNALRFGTGIKLGFEGLIVEPWYINASWSLSLLNLLGKDDARGELFTPNIDKEGKENNSYNFNFNFLVQYRL